MAPVFVTVNVIVPPSSFTVTSLTEKPGQSASSAEPTGAVLLPVPLVPSNHWPVASSLIVPMPESVPPTVTPDTVCVAEYTATSEKSSAPSSTTSSVGTNRTSMLPFESSVAFVTVLDQLTPSVDHSRPERSTEVLAVPEVTDKSTLAPGRPTTVNTP